MRVILRAGDALAALSYPGHILLYAPGDAKTCRITRLVASPLWGQRKRCSKTLMRFCPQHELFSAFWLSF